MAPPRKPRRRRLAKRGLIGLSVAQAHGPVRRREMAKRQKARGAGEATVPPARSSSERERLEAAVASLSSLNADQLRLQWRNHLGGIAPAHLPGWLLARLLAYRIQAAAFGDLEAFVAATGASIHHGGGRAFYRPATDSIQLLPREAFIGSPTSSPAEAYYSTLLHELTHWTGDETRCNRQFGKRFGDQAYAIEELVAELGAAFLCADLRITDEPRADHAQYLAAWLSVLKADKKAIFTAASKASEAAAFLAAFPVA
jgi:hypothetical protein